MYDGYRDIPGVTPVEIASVERLKESRTHFVYGAVHTSEAFLNEEGRIRGFASDFADYLGRLFGIPFVIELHSFGDLMDGLQSGEIDFTGDLTPTPQRMAEFSMTGRIAERAVNSFTLRCSPTLDEIAAERPPRLGFLNGTVTESLVREVLESPFEAYYAEGWDDAARLIESGEIDAFLVDAPAEVSFESRSDIETAPFYPAVNTYVSLATARRELKPITDVVDKLLLTDAAFELTEMYNRCEAEYRGHKLRSALTDEEREYLRDFTEIGSAIPVLFEHDNYPICFYNEKINDWQGIVPDVLKEMSELLGVKFAPANSPTLDWTGIMRMLEKGEGLMVSELIRTPEREGRFIWADEPYAHNFYALLSRNDFRDVKPNEVRFMNVATLLNSGYESIFKKWFPTYGNIGLFGNPKDALAALDSGTIDLFMASDNMLLYANNYLEKNDFKLNIVLAKPGEAVFGFNKDAPELRSIVGKGMGAINLEDISNRWKLRVFDYDRSALRQGLPVLAAFTAALLFAFMFSLFLFVKNWRMKRNLESLVAARTSELQIQKEAAQSASMAKSEFLARMSHEMRTPLNAIMGMTDIALRSTDMDRINYCGEMVRDASRHMLSMINDILDMSRMESNKGTVINTDFETRGLMRRVEGMAYYMAERRSQKIRIDVSPDVPEWVCGDSSHITQVIMNLLSNAVKFSPDGGQITLSVELASQTEPSIGENFFMRISVEDEGIGISEESKKKIFQSFEQLDGGMTRRYGGMGLGLAIAKRLVEVMGGDLWVESERSRGSKFIFTVPVTRTLPGDKSNSAHGEATDRFADAVSAEREARALGHRCILVAEDLEINRDIVSAFLEDLDIVIDFAENGREAVEKFKAGEGVYDLILMDIQMPEMNGLDACKAIRALGTERAASVPIVAMTANVFKEDVDNCLAAGMNDHIGKPVDRILLLRKLAEHISARGLSRETQAP